MPNELKNETFEPYAMVEYVGLKPFKVDSVTASGVTWNGPGDVQGVPLAKAEILEARHPDQWQINSVVDHPDPEKNAQIQALKELKSVESLSELMSDPSVGAAVGALKGKTKKALAFKVSPAKKPKAVKPGIQPPDVELPEGPALETSDPADSFQE